MKISLHWLKDFIDLRETNPEELARRITASVGEVDAVQVQGVLLEATCVGKVLSIEKHPNADKLSICRVMTDKGEKRVVCGGTNLRVGMRVAFAHIGARVRWHGEEMQTLELVKIRGEESEGMICAAEELDLAARFPDSTGRNIVDIGDGDEGVGSSLRDFLGLSDVVFHIDNHAITHRADLFSHEGVARELVALGLATWKEKPKNKAIAFGKDPIPFSFKNDIKDLVPRYAACIIQIDGLGQTPDWMRKRLEATGFRSVSLPVDITNYVSLETGMPLHAFDAADLKGDVHIRLSKEGEKITTLDAVERKLPEGAIVLSDDAGIFDLMGIMGGLRSSTKESTKKIYLHSTAVDPASIRRTIIATGHRTEAATVYEKGIPRIAVEKGFLRALELFLELVPGARIASEKESWGDDGSPKTFDLPLSRVHSMLGNAIPLERAEEILTGLEFLVKTKKGTDPLLTVTTPLHRLGDIKGEHDLIEEIGRIAGYDSIELVMPSVAMNVPARDMRLHALRDNLKEEGFIELVPLSLVGASLLKKSGMDPAEAMGLNNPIGEETSLLHTSTLPTLLEHAQRNLALVDGSLRTSHASNVFKKGGEQHLELGLLLTSKQGTLSLPANNFLLLKRDLEEALAPLGYFCSVGPSTQASKTGHPGQSADVTVSGQVVGQIFTVHPSIASAFELPSAAAATVHLDRLFSIKPEPSLARPIPTFPAVSYDETLTLTQKSRAGALLSNARSKSELLESLDLVDLFQGKQHKKGEYNLTLRFTYRAKDRTLTEEEAQKEHATVVQSISKGK